MARSEQVIRSDIHLVTTLMDQAEDELERGEYELSRIKLSEELFFTRLGIRRAA